MKVPDLVAELNEQGWTLERIRGSHHVYAHPKAVRVITVPVHGREIPDFYVKSILKQARQALKKEG